MPPKLKLSAKDSAGTRPLFSVIIRSDAPVPPGLDTTYDKWSRQDYKSIPGDSYSTLHHFLLHQAELRGLATSQQNQKNAFLKFLMIKYDNLLSDDNKLPPTRRKTLPTLAADALKYTNHHPVEVAAVEETTGGEVAVPGLEMPPLSNLPFPTCSYLSPWYCMRWAVLLENEAYQNKTPFLLARKAPRWSDDAGFRASFGLFLPHSGRNSSGYYRHLSNRSSNSRLGHRWASPRRSICFVFIL